MIHQLYQKQVEAWKEETKDINIATLIKKPEGWLSSQFLSSRHKDTIELLEAEIERKKGMRKEYEHFEKETPYYSVNENMRRHESYNKCLDEDIAYLEGELRKFKNEQ